MLSISAVHVLMKYRHYRVHCSLTSSTIFSVLNFRFETQSRPEQMGKRRGEREREKDVLSSLPYSIGIVG